MFILFIDERESRKRRHRSTFSEFSSQSDEALSKRGCVEPPVTADLEAAGSGSTRLHPNEDRPDLVSVGLHEAVSNQDDPVISRLAFSSSNLDTEAAIQPHRRLPVVPKPRFPAAVLPTPSLAAMLAPSAPFNHITPVAPLPFCFTPSADYQTAVPPSSPTLPPPPLFALYHPAFWGAMPYLISRALLSGEQVREEPVCGFGTRFPADADPQSLWPGLCQFAAKSWEPVRRRICDSPSPPPDISLRPVQEAASSGLEDMAKMVSRLDEAKRMIV